MRATLRLNPQQLAVVDRHVRGSLDALLAEAVREDAELPPEPRWAQPRPGGCPPSPTPPDARLDTEVAAGTGLGVVLAAGEILRVEQTSGGQCADLEAFTWSGPRRRFDAARTRAAHGARVTTGAVLWSSPPEVALLELIADSAGPHDLLYPACSEAELLAATGVSGHGSCVEIQAEAQRAWGLSPSDAHDPLNLWLPTDVDRDGRLRYWPAACRQGDFVELRALHDVLVVVNPCASDLFGATQWELGSIRVVVRGSGPTIAPPGPEPAWRLRGMPVLDVPVELPAELEPHVAAVRALGWLGDTDAEVLRALLLRAVERRGAGGS
jgi:uncharacterized protein YcgI (DUF1989 family)